MLPTEVEINGRSIGVWCDSKIIFLLISISLGKELGCIIETMTDVRTHIKPPISLESVYSLLGDLRLKVRIESERGDYAFEYYTDRFLGQDPENPVLTRAYRLLDLARGSSIKSPWDKFDLEKQTQLLSVLLSDGRYQIKKVIKGWRVVCPECHREFRGEIWQPPPAKCLGRSDFNCTGTFLADMAEELKLDDWQTV